MADKTPALKRVTLRLDPALYEQVKHFAAQDDMSVNEFMQASIEHYIDWILHDYDLPAASIKRLNQLVDAQNAVKGSLDALALQTQNGFAGLYGVMSGGDYLSHDTDEDEV